MKKNIISFMFLLFLSFCLFAETTEEVVTDAAASEGWKKPVITVSLNFSQAGFDNWAEGGENNWAWTAFLLATENWDVEKWAWDNGLKFKYGMLTTDSDDTKKSDDEIRFDSMLRYKLGTKIDPFIAFMWQTQLMPGHIYSPKKIEISRFMDPGYFKESIGFVYLPLENLSLRLGAAVKHTVTNMYTLMYAGVDERFKTEPGVEAVLGYTLKLADNILYVSKAEVFSDFKSSDRIDITWDNTVTAKFSEYFNMTFNFMMKYDKDISTKRQIKESITIGVTYNFI